MGDVGELHRVPVPPSLLGESPMWHPKEGVLYWCDIAGHALNRWNPTRREHDAWFFDNDVSCCSPLLDGGLLLALRDGLLRFDPATNARHRLVRAPYLAHEQRFNDGKADPQGRFWVGTVHEKREPQGALYRYVHSRLERVIEHVTTSNGLAWSPDGRTMYWADTRLHCVFAFDVDAQEGTLSRRRVFAQFEQGHTGQDVSSYSGRPDGAAVDVEGCYWVAMYEGGRLLRLSPEGEVLREVKLPVQCPTMPCFGGSDLKTLYITTSRARRPEEELEHQPWAGCVLQMQVDVCGLPVNFATL